MRRLIVLSLGMISAVFNLGCGSEQQYKSKLEVQTKAVPQLVINRYEDVLFSIDTTRFQETLSALQSEYLPFLDGDLADSAAVNDLKEFATDTFSRSLYHKVKTAYPDLNAVEQLLSSVYQHYWYYYPDEPLPTKIYSCVSGINPNIPPVMFTDNALVISLDWYLDRDSVYEKIGMPLYRSQRTGTMNLAADLGDLIWKTHLPDRHKQTTILEEMVYEGKRLFFVEALFPEITDEALLGYSKEQLRWARENEGDLWADIVGNQRLYSSDYDLFRVFFADGPFTNEYSHEAPARLGEFIGLNIVRSYFGSHDIRFQDLIDDEDLQGLFLDSGYKPKKQ